MGVIITPENTFLRSNIQRKSHFSSEVLEEHRNRSSQPPSLSTTSMPASTASPPEQMLSDTLSARSYLQLSREARRDNEQASSQTPSSQNLEEETSPVIKRSARHLRPRKRPAPQSKTESTKHEVVESSDLPADYHPARKRGRPRLETEKDAAAVQVTKPAFQDFDERTLLT